MGQSAGLKRQLGSGTSTPVQFFSLNLLCREKYFDSLGGAFLPAVQSDFTARPAVWSAAEMKMLTDDTLICSCCSLLDICLQLAVKRTHTS